MTTASLSELKKELASLSTKELSELCLRLSKYKKENKELLSYLLFEASNEGAYILGVKEEIDTLFSEIMSGNIRNGKKILQKALRTTKKFIKYSGQKQTEVELLLYILKAMSDSKVRFRRYTATANLYDRTFQKLKKTLESLHPDLQFDYQLELEKLQESDW